MSVGRRKPPTHAAAPYCAIMRTPFARVGVRTRAGRLVRVDYLPTEGIVQSATHPFALEVCRQISAYLDDGRHDFDLPCDPVGTPFQRSVWREISDIACGSTRTYGELARRLGSSARPVGGACGSNPIPLIVPCHRVVAASGGLGGFMHSRSPWQLDIKRWLLRHEAD